MKDDKKVLKNNDPVKTEAEEKKEERRRMRLMKQDKTDEQKEEQKLRKSDGPLDDAMDAYGLRSFMHPVTFLKIYGDSDNVLS